MTGLFGNQGLFHRKIPGFVHRPGQLRMAEAVAELLARNGQNTEDGAAMASCLAVEAETGLGKTLAYLVPAVCSGKKVVISTNTKNLQDQILHREIPLLKQYLAPDLSAVCVKGRQNYLCLYRWRQFEAGQHEALFGAKTQKKLIAWLKKTRHGDQAELDWLGPSSPGWQAICCLNHFCLGQNCPDYAACFLTRLRRDAAKADVLVVNHHLLFSDLAVRSTGFGEVLPRYESVLFDEAHHLENVAGAFFGETFSKRQVIDFTGDLERDGQEFLSGNALAALIQSTAALGGAVERLALAFPTERGRFPLNWHEPGYKDAARFAEEFIALLLSSADSLASLAANHEGCWKLHAERAADLAERLEHILYGPAASECGAVSESAGQTDEQTNFTCWYERTEYNLSLSITPVEVAKEFRKHLYPAVRHCLFTSATLTSGGDFTYFFRQVGLPDETPSLFLASPFDYAKRTRIYVPEQDFPAPDSPGHQKALHDRLEALVRCAGGRALLLFTSRRAMEAAHEVLAQTLPFPVFMQGEASRHTLLERFRGETESVLFAVASFWEGVDIPGESLSLVVMDKLPFEVPTDPVMKARMQRILDKGGNPFYSFQIPRAIFTLRQGAGRLMRTAEDRGVIAVLDVRIVTKSYGRTFLKSLPPGPVVRDLASIANFFSENAQ